MIRTALEATTAASLLAVAFALAEWFGRSAMDALIRLAP